MVAKGAPNIMLMVGGGRGERRVELGGETLETVRVSVSVSSVESVRCGQKLTKKKGEKRSTSRPYSEKIMFPSQ